MVAALLSQQRPKLVNTYSGRAKRQRGVLKTSQVHSDSEQSSGADAQKEATKSIKMEMRSQSAGTKGKKVEVLVQGSPKSSKPSSKRASPGRTTRASGAKPYPSSKPSSNAKPSSFRLPTPDDDASSNGGGGSADGTPRVRRTEAERIKVFQDHPDCDEVEPHRAHCTRCNKWLSLGTRQTYAVSPWEKHRESCDRKPPRGETHSATPEADDTGSAGHSEQEPVRRTEAERQAILEADSRAEQVLPNEALCKKCQKWVKLSPKQRYALYNWNKHQLRCSGSAPSSRIATAERKLKLVNDSQAKSFTPRSVDCRVCGATVALDGEYILTKWEEHKETCSGTKPASKRSPVSTNSDETLVAPSTTATGSKRGTKRARESDDEDAEETAPQPPQQRARTENYVPPEKEAPSVLGWFLMPFQNFMAGLRDGLKSSSD